MLSTSWFPQHCGCTPLSPAFSPDRPMRRWSLLLLHSRPQLKRPPTDTSAGSKRLCGSDEHEPSKGASLFLGFRPSLQIDNRTLPLLANSNYFHARPILAGCPLWRIYFES